MADSLSTQASALAFSFSDQPMRVVVLDDGPWFVSADILNALSLDRKAMERLDSDEKGVSSIHTPGGQQTVAIVNESGLYSLILGSRKPEAKKFKKWVTSEVLPAIRKTGGYQQPASEQHILRCWQMANSLASAAQQALFDVLVQHGEEELYIERLMIGFGHDRRPHVQKIDRRAMVTTLEKLATAIEEPNGICLTDVELATLGKVCTQRLAQRISYRANKQSPELKVP